MQGFGSIPIFVSVVEAKSFSGAAEKLGITKSAVSKRISGLEVQLGVKLFHRSTRTLSLTEAGERYLVHAVKALNAAQDAESAATELQNIPSGLLRVSAPMSFGRLHVAPIIPLFLEKYPHIRLHLDMSDLSHHVIAEGFDIALKGGQLEDSSLVARKLMPLHSVLCASADYLALNGLPNTPQELTYYNCILFTYHTTVNEWVFIKDGEEERVQISGNYQVNNSEALCDALIQGVGIGRLPTFVAAPHIESGKLIPLLQDYRMPHKTMYAVFPARQFLPEKVRVFLDFLIQHLANDIPDWDQTG